MKRIPFLLTVLSLLGLTTVEFELEEVSLISPADNAENVALMPTFAWDAVEDAESYQIQVSDRGNMNRPVIDVSGVDGTSFTLEAQLSQDQKYFWRVRALEDDDDDDDKGPWSDRWSFKTGKLPTEPSLSSPDHGEDNVPLTPQLVWQSAGDAESYEIELSLDSDFSSLVFSQDGIAGTSMEVATALQSNTRYYWHVRGSNETGDGPFSDTRWFETVASAPSQVTLSSPADGATGVPTTPTFSWQSVSGAGTYTVEVSESSNFGSLLVAESGLVSTSFTPDRPFVNGAVLYWRVRASNSAGDGPDSSVRHFTTITGGPTQVTLVSPPDGSDDVGDTPTLIWQAVDGAANYRVQVSKQSNFAGEIIHDTIVSGTQLQIGPLEPAQTFYWRVRASNAGSVNWSQVADFETGSGAPSAVVLESPADGAADQPLEITLSWAASDGAQSYDLDVGLDASFGTILLSETGLDATSYVLEGLDHSTEYFWRVRARNDIGMSAWSSARSFTTRLVLAPAAPALIYPPNEAEDVGDTPVFSWNEVEDADSYKLELSTAPPDDFENFVTVVIAVVVEQPFFQSPKLSLGQDYYWRVESRNAAGSTRSPLRTFRTALTTASESDDELPTAFSLEQNYPNPFNPSTTIGYDVPEAADVTLTVLDQLGRVVETLGVWHRAPGTYTVTWDARNMPSGVYMVRMEANGFVGLRSMLLVR